MNESFGNSTAPRISPAMIRRESQSIIFSRRLENGLAELRKNFEQARSISKSLLGVENKEPTKLQRAIDFLNLEHLIIQAYFDDRGEWFYEELDIVDILTINRVYSKESELLKDNLIMEYRQSLNPSYEMNKIEKFVTRFTQELELELEKLKTEFEKFTSHITLITTLVNHDEELRKKIEELNKQLDKLVKSSLPVNKKYDAKEEAFFNGPKILSQPVYKNDKNEKSEKAIEKNIPKIVADTQVPELFDEYNEYSDQLILRRDMLKLTIAVDKISELHAKLTETVSQFTYDPSFQKKLVDLLEKINSSSDLKMLHDYLKQTKLNIFSDRKVDSFSDYWKVRDLLIQLYDQYDWHLNQLNTNSPSAQSLFTLARIHGPGIGYHYLHPHIYERIEAGNTNNLSAVIKLSNLALKVKSETYPIGHAVDAFNKIISGNNSLVSESVIVEKDKISIPIIISNTIEGEDFRHLLMQNPEAVNKYLDSDNYSFYVLLSLITGLTAKPEHFIAVIEEKKGKINHLQLQCTNNDNAFEYPIYVDDLGDHFLNIKNIIYCLPQMDNVISSHVREAILKQPAELIILGWLKELSLQNNQHRQSNDSLRFLPKTVLKIYKLLKLIQNILRSDPNITHQKLLDKVDPIIGACYSYVRKHKASALQAIDYISQDPKIEKDLGLATNLVALLNEHNKKTKNIHLDRQQTLHDACAEWINQLDYSQLEKSTATTIINSITTDFNFVKTLTLRNDQHLTDERFSTLIQSLPQLDSIHLINCPSIVGSGLYAALKYRPNISIRLEKFGYINGQYLLQIARNCKNLYFTLENNKTYSVQVNGMELYKAALVLKNENFNKFLLYYAGIEFLHAAIGERSLSVVEQLITLQFDFNKKDEKGHTALDIGVLREKWAKKSNNPQHGEDYAKIIIILLKAGAHNTKYPEDIAKIGIDYLSKNKKDDLLRQKLFLFMRSYHCLKDDQLPFFVDKDLTSVDLSFSKDYYLSTFKINENFIQALLRYMPKLQQIDLTGCDGLTSKIINVLTTNNISVVIMSSIQAEQCQILTANTLHTLNNINIKINKTTVVISEIELRGLDFKSYDERKLSHALENNPNIRSFAMFKCKNITKPQMKILAKSIKSLKNLKELRVQNNSFEANAVGPVVDILADNPTLEVFNFSWNGARPDDMKDLGIVLKQNRVLRVISLYGNPISDKGVEYLIEGVNHKDSKLKIISLAEIQLTLDGIIMISKMLVKNKMLEKLDLRHNQLQKNVVDYLLDALLENKTLEYLDIKIGNTLSDHQLIAIEQWQKIRSEEKIMRNILSEETTKHRQVTFYQPKTLISPEQKEIESLKEEVARLKDQLDALKNKKWENFNENSKIAHKIFTYFNDQTLIMAGGVNKAWNQHQKSFIAQKIKPEVEKEEGHTSSSSQSMSKRKI
jgi:hypothetical protein